MSAIKKSFAVASLFEGTEYISVFADGTGMCIGRIYTEGEEFKAVAITGATKMCYSLQEAKLYIRKLPAFKDTRIAYKIELFKVNQFDQRSYVDTFYSKEGAARMKATLERREPEYTFVLIPYYNDELKLF